MEEGLEGGEYWSSSRVSLESRREDEEEPRPLPGAPPSEVVVVGFGLRLGATTWKAEVPLDPGSPTSGRSGRSKMPGEEEARGEDAARGERPKVGVRGEEEVEGMGLPCGKARGVRSMATCAGAREVGGRVG